MKFKKGSKGAREMSYAFKDWFKERYGFIPEKMEDLNFSAQLKEAWETAQKMRTLDIIKFLEDRDETYCIDCEHLEKCNMGNVCCAIEEVKKEFLKA